MNVLYELQTRAKGLSLLCVEDDEELLLGLEKLLKKFFQRVETARNGVEGLEKYVQDSYDIVISDINMPEMNGLAMLRRIKELNPDQQTIVLSAFDDKTFLIEAIEIGVDHYTLKPVNKSLLFMSLVKCIDTLELRQKVEEQKQLILQQSRISAMEDLMFNVSHHWRQPLNEIATSVQLLQLDFESGDETVDTEYVREFVNQNMHTVTALSHSLDMFKSFYRPDNDKSFDIQQAIKDMSALLYSTFKEEEIDVCYSVAEGSAECNIDEMLDREEYEKIVTSGNSNDFKQVLLAIIQNSKEAIATAIMDKKITRGKIDLGLTQQGDAVHFSVTDNGGGIVEELSEKVFDPFFTSHDIANKKGLGLYLAKTLVEKRLGGTIALKNVSQGLQVTITLKKAPAPS